VLLFTGAALWLAASIPASSLVEWLVRSLLLVLSPLTLAWGRWILTETLAVAAGMAVFAVILRALHARRVSLPALALTLAAAILIRWDQVWLVLPAVALLWLILPRRQAARSTIGLGLLLAIPLGALSVRAMLHGLPPIPAQNVTEELAPNLLRFWSAHALDQRATSGLIWPSWTRDYPRIRELASGAVSAAVPRDELAQLLDRLAATEPRTDFPAALDSTFGALSDRVAAEHPVATRVGVPLARSFRLWAYPDGIFYSGWQGVGEFAERWEPWRAAYRLGLLGVVVLLCIRASTPRMRQAGGLVLLYVAARTGFLIWPGVNALETRYLVEAIPLLEILVLWVVGSRLKAALSRDAQSAG
jgi:hypothetical protein